MSRRAHVLNVAVWCAFLAVPIQARASDVVTEWNQIALTLTLTAVPAQAPVQQIRTMAIFQVSVHDAINAITRQYETYSETPPAPASGSPEAAAIAAAYYALNSLFPAQASSLDLLYSASLTAHSVPAGDPGLEFGRSIAAEVFAVRATDHASEAQFDYIVPGAGQIGVWTRLGGAPALLPGWGNVTPWVLRSGAQFRPDAPVDLTSDTYAKDYNEVQSIGSITSPVRTNEQTQIALFWRASPSAIWNVVLAKVLAAQNLDLSSTARAFALMYLAAADSSIACWDAKYTYNFWRPFPAIVNGDLDGNPATTGDPTWQSLLPTPPHPGYPSGHATNSSAMALVLERLFGDEPAVPIEVTLSGITRRWLAFDEAVDEVIDARVYSGIHYRTSDEVGARLGRQVAQFVLTHVLRPVRPSVKP
jgi:membrane-associated phospholipid phosphatase